MTPEESQLRFVAAALAMQGIVGGAQPGWIKPGDAPEIAKRSVALADALLLELQKPVPTV